MGFVCDSLAVLQSVESTVCAGRAALFVSLRENNYLVGYLFRSLFLASSAIISRLTVLVQLRSFFVCETCASLIIPTQ